MDGLLRNDEIFIRRTFRFGRKSGLRRRVSPVGGSFRFSISMDDASGDLQKEMRKTAVAISTFGWKFSRIPMVGLLI